MAGGRAATAGQMLSIAIADTGCGIPEGSRQRLFEAFFTTKSKGKGTGLGLAIVQRIVLEHHGAILVGTEVGKGSTFEIMLPIAVGAEAAADKVAETASLAPRAAPGPPSVLLLDDDTALCEMMALTMVRSGYRVYSVHDPRECIRLIEARADDWDALVTDVSMPHINGDVVVECFRRRYPGGKTLVFSGFVTADASGRFGNADAFIRKPFQIHEFLEVLGRLLEGGTSREGK